MARKKLTALVLVCSFVLFCGVSCINFDSAREYVLQDMMASHFVTIQNVRDSMLQFYKFEEKYSEEENISNLHENITRRSPLFNQNDENIVYSYVVADRQGNIILSSENDAEKNLVPSNLHDETYESVKSKLDEELKSFDYSSNHTRSISIYSEDGCFFPVIETEGDLHFIGFAKYKPVNKTLASDFFRYRMINSVLVFIALTAVNLVIATVMYKKSNKSNGKHKEEIICNH